MAGFKTGDTPTFNVWSQATQGIVWDDLRVPLDASRRGGSRDPDFNKFIDNGAGSQGLFAWHFSSSTEEELYFSIQFAHDWKIGSDIEPHMHWCPSDTGVGDVRWGLEYSWIDINGVFLDSTIIYATNDPASGVENTHQYASWGLISPPASVVGVSSMMMCRLFRDVANDNYGSDAIALEFDIHYQRDSVGSRKMHAKE